MGEVRILNYSTVAGIMEQINEKLLANGKGLLLEATVNHKNEIVDMEIVTVPVALQRGFEPCKMLPKGKSSAKTD